jgi:hypothetical protein
MALVLRNRRFYSDPETNKADSARNTVKKICEICADFKLDSIKSVDCDRFTQEKRSKVQLADSITLFQTLKPHLFQ